MIRILVLCLLLFPLTFIGALVMTGTLQDYVVPQIKRSVSSRFGTGEEAIVPETPTFPVVDSLIVAELAAREAEIAAGLDSLSTLRNSLDTERVELARLKEDVSAFVDTLRTLRGDLEAKQASQRKAMAKIFSEMEPLRAARILPLLEPEHRIFLLRSMQKRQAAQILATLDPEIAAGLSDRLMMPEDRRR